MKTNAERAQERLTLTPKTEFTLKKDGFIGALYQPEQDEYPGKAVIMFGGSDGIYNLTKLVAEQYVKRGMTILALAYWNEPGLPDGFEKVPVDSVEKAVLWLRGQGFENVGLWGISMGAELALLAGSLMPQSQLSWLELRTAPTSVSKSTLMSGPSFNFPSQLPAGSLDVRAQRPPDRGCDTPFLQQGDKALLPGDAAFLIAGARHIVDGN